MNILVVDDNKTDRELLSFILKNKKINVFEAADGSQALKFLLKDILVDGIISDVIMPNIDGYQLCCQVRFNSKFKQIPFILYSAYSYSFNDEQLMKKVGVDNFFSKPTDIDILISAIDEIRQKRSIQPIMLENCSVIQEYDTVLINQLKKKNLEIKHYLELDTYMLNLRIKLKTTQSELKCLIDNDKIN